jgi:hypothetical protein
MTADKQSLHYLLAEMMSTGDLFGLAAMLGVSLKRGAKVVLINQLLQAATLTDAERYCRHQWRFTSRELHLANLQSGILTGHSWHNAAPSRLHLSLQDRVRDVCSGKVSLKQFLGEGTDIAKHEYFMVAISDLSESVFIERLGAIPPTKTRCISDFMWNGIPYDLKNTVIKKGWDIGRIEASPDAYAQELTDAADANRDREITEGELAAWRGNRFYVVTSSEDLWLTQPQQLLDELERKAGKLGGPIELRTKQGISLSHVVTLTGSKT